MAAGKQREPSVTGWKRKAGEGGRERGKIKLKKHAHCTS